MKWFNRSFPFFFFLVLQFVEPSSSLGQQEIPATSYMSAFDKKLENHGLYEFRIILKALENKDIEGLRNALENCRSKGIDLNKRGKHGITLLHYAIGSEFIDGVKELLKAGADPDLGLFEDVPESFSKAGDTPLMMSASFVQKDACLAALEYSRNYKTAVDGMGYTLIGCAAHRTVPYDAKFMQALIDRGLDVNNPGKGEFPLFVAHKSREYDSAIALLKAGADPLAKNRFGLDFFQHCKQSFLRLEFIPRVNQRSSEPKPRLEFLDWLDQNNTAGRKVRDFHRVRIEQIKDLELTIHRPISEQNNPNARPIPCIIWIGCDYVSDLDLFPINYGYCVISARMPAEDYLKSCGIVINEIISRAGEWNIDTNRLVIAGEAKLVVYHCLGMNKSTSMKPIAAIVTLRSDEIAEIGFRPGQIEGLPGVKLDDILERTSEEEIKSLPPFLFLDNSNGKFAIPSTLNARSINARIEDIYDSDLPKYRQEILDFLDARTK